MVKKKRYRKILAVFTVNDEKTNNLNSPKIGQKKAVA